MRILASMAAGALALFVFWCFAIDFTERGIDLGFSVLLTILVIGFCYTFLAVENND